MAKPMIITVKSFTYRGQAEEFSNAYHFNETPPANPAAWRTLIDAFVAAEKLIFGPDVTFPRAYGYADSAADATVLVDYLALSITNQGAMSATGKVAAPGDAAFTVRWATSKKSTKGKNVYLRKYFHNAFIANALVNNDTLDATQKTAAQTFADKLKNGTITGFTLCGADGTMSGIAAVNPWVTTRTLKRRGKRPPS
jgi:hypothetical protein